MKQNLKLFDANCSIEFDLKRTIKRRFFSITPMSHQKTHIQTSPEKVIYTTASIHRNIGMINPCTCLYGR
jgi:hypothetical protein